ncbi:unnamed protein product [Protopolystoma xenopodis]|uniref:Uncharacterized protein n=1 Tax=Protopolystoma xenopodis TaxID=117903 RepID=A0A448XSZ6_9PLAT|nr:unnamed protein product [Protopolystoma xenopodis]
MPYKAVRRPSAWSTPPTGPLGCSSNLLAIEVTPTSPLCPTVSVVLLSRRFPRLPPIAAYSPDRNLMAEGTKLRRHAAIYVFSHT